MPVVLSTLLGLFQNVVRTSDSYGKKLTACCTLHQPTVHMGDGWTQSLSDSFALKVRNIKLHTSVLASQLTPTLPCVREVLPAVMTCLRPVTLSEVLLLLCKMAPKSSRLDVIIVIIIYLFIAPLHDLRPSQRCIPSYNQPEVNIDDQH